MFNTSPFRKNILTRFYKYNSANPVETELDYNLKFTNSSNDGLETIENYPYTKKVVTKSEEYYIIRVTCNQNYTCELNATGDQIANAVWGDTDISMQGLLQAILTSNGQKLTRAMQLYNIFEPTVQTSLAIVFIFELVEITDKPSYGDFSKHWEQGMLQCGYCPRNISTGKYEYKVGNVCSWHLKKDDNITIDYVGDTL